jgi:hypothetical protein
VLRNGGSEEKIEDGMNVDAEVGAIGGRGDTGEGRIVGGG